MKRNLLFMLFFIPACYAKSVPSNELIKQSEQLLVVMTPDWDAVQGKMQRYHRSTKTHQWTKVGESLPVVVGKKGMAWGAEIGHGKKLIKKEGDKKTPVGVYTLGPLFGFAQTTKMKFSYLPLNDKSVCVDDVNSKFYNQLLDSTKVSSDWNSSEKMRSFSEYQLGSVIHYNERPTVKGAGSCIFLHIWQNPKLGTAGCVAMKKSDLKAVLTWLDPNQKPVIVMLTQPAYQQVKTKWSLPKNL